MQWWKRPGFLDYLVAMAGDLEEENREKHFYAVGHSPFWLIYALGALRKARGQAAQVGYIPFSGKILAVEPESLRHEDGIISFGPDPYRGASENAIQGYFNFLMRRGLDPAHIQEKTGPGADKIILVDFLTKGNGFASFLRLYDRLAGAQNKGSLTEKFALTAYKMAYRDGPQLISLPPLGAEKDQQKRLYKVEIKTGTPAGLLNILSGYQGCPPPGIYEDQESGRFMPYYPLIDHYKGFWDKHTAPQAGLRTAKFARRELRPLKDALHAAIERALADPEAHRQKAAQAQDEIEKTMMKPRNKDISWLPAYGFYH